MECSLKLIPQLAPTSPLVRSFGCANKLIRLEPERLRGMLKPDGDTKGELGGEVSAESLFTTSDKDRKIPPVSKLSLNS